MLSNHDKAIQTYEALKKRREEKQKRINQDFLGHVVANMDRVYKKNSKGRKRSGQI